MLDDLLVSSDHSGNIAVLHTRRPNNLLMMDCALPLQQEDCGLIENSRRLAAKLPQL